MNIIDFFHEPIQKKSNTTQTSMNTQPMNQQDMMKMFMQTFSTAAMETFKMMQQQAATPAVPAAPAPAVVDAKKVVAVKKTTTSMSASEGGALRWKENPDKMKALIKDLIALKYKCKTETEFLEKALKVSDFTQTIIANARCKKDVSSRTEGLKLLWKEFPHVLAWLPPVPKKKKPVIKKKKKRSQKWENLGGYYAVDDDMLKDRCVKATTAGIGVAKKSFTIAEQKYVQELVNMARASTIRADDEDNIKAAAKKFAKDPAMQKYEGKYFQLILDFPNLSNREYGWKIMLRLYAPGCPPLEDKGISKKNKKRKPTSPPNMYDAIKNRRSASAAPLVISAPTQAIAQTAAKKQKVVDAVGSPTTVKDLIPYRRQVLIKALKHCQLPDAQYSAEKWKSNYGPMLGCTKAKFHRHIEVRLNVQGFKWDDYGQGKGKWCLDHMTPIRNFLQTDDEDVKRCWHYTNIMPEDYEYNTWKSDKMIWRMCWSFDRWLVQGRNESFRGEENYWRGKGMPLGAWVDFNRVKVQEEQDEQKIVFN